MRFSTTIFGCFIGLASAEFGYQRGIICNDAGFANSGCQADRKACFDSCAGVPGCRSHCNQDCDKCTFAQIPSTLGTKYQTCVTSGGIATCDRNQACANDYNSAIEHCYAQAPGGLSGMNADDCGSLKAIQKCCKANDVGCESGTDCCSNFCGPKGTCQYCRFIERPFTKMLELLLT